MILKMSEDKNLTITKSGNTYEDENNAEIIKVLLPRIINNNDLTECIVHLCILNQDGLGDEMNISSALKEYSNNLYVADVSITNKITYKSGQIQFWIKILNTKNELVAKTNIVSYRIKEHKDIEDYIPEQNLTLLDDFSIRMEQSLEKTNYAIEVVERIKEKLDNLDVGELSEELIRNYIDEALKEVINNISVVTPVRAFVNILGGIDNWTAEDVLDNNNKVIGKRYGQIVNVNNATITPNSKVDLQITSEQMVIFHEKDLAFVAENDDGVVTIYCVGSIPQNDYSIQAVITEVVIDD